MKIFRSRFTKVGAHMSGEQVEATMQRVQRTLAISMSIALFGLLALGGEMGSRQNIADALSLGAPQLNPWLGLGALVVLIALNGLFLASETAVESLKPVHVKHIREVNANRAERLQNLMQGATRICAALALASQTSKVLMIVVCFLIAPLALAAFTSWFGWPSNWLTVIGAMLIVMVPVGFLNLIFGELIPRSMGALHPQAVGGTIFRFIKITAAVLSPLTALVTGTASLFLARYGGRAALNIGNLAEEEIRTIVDTAEVAGEIEQEEKEMLHSVFEFTDTIAREVMTPRVDLDAMPVRSDPTELVNVIQESGHSRIPIYEDTDDQIVGIIHAKDLLMAFQGSKPPNLRSLMRPVLFVPENKNLHELLEDMRRHRTQMAIVQDEFGGTAGIVTIEDIVEELVGDIVDEYDVEEPEIQEADGAWLVDGRAQIDDVNYDIGSTFASSEFDTIGGYVFGLFGRQPAVDETIESHGFRFIVAESDGRRIARMRVEKIPVEAESASTELV